MTEEADSPDVKRRRIAAANDGCPQHNIIRCLRDLPNGILAHTASFLSPPSRVLFAIALDENSGVTINERSSAIIDNQWDVLDFGEIEKEVAKKLTDTDVTKALLCTDAVNNLKRLKLTNCTNITGTCLEPLRGSLIIEQIDLSHPGDNRKSITPLSCDHVLPILDSIIEREDCALKYLWFPSAWRQRKRPTGSEFHAFIRRYNEMRRNWGTLNCLECNQSLPGDGEEWIETSTFSECYGFQLHTCYGCLKHYCYGCNIDGEEKDMLQDCDVCGRDYCKGCSGVTECYGYDCENDICDDCYKNECCVGCNRASCSECVQEGVTSVHKCDFCNKCYCRGCYDNEVADIFYSCSRCKERCCIECLLRRYRRGQLDCAGCIKAIAPHRLLVDENKQLQKENEQLKAEVEALKRQIEAAGG